MQGGHKIWKFLNEKGKKSLNEEIITFFKHFQSPMQVSKYFSPPYMYLTY